MAKILVIEDDEQFRDMLLKMLKLDGHSTFSAENGEVGLQMAIQQKPQLIISDILMPKIDGIELILALTEKGIDIPVIAMSGGRREISAEFNLESAAMMGVKSILAKPFARADLRRAITEALTVH